MDEILLDVRGVSKHFKGIHALTDVTFQVTKGSIISMIGPNGAGKTTFINVVSGIHKADGGEILFQGKNIENMPAHVVTTVGISRTFQLEELFISMSVVENAMVGCHSVSHSGLLSSGFALPRARKEERAMREEAMANLRMVGLENRASDPISKLPLGERKLVGIARALCVRPKLLMLDEPAGGLAAHEVEKLVQLIYELVRRGITIFIVEHNMPFVMSISERVIVLNDGARIAEGPPQEVQSNPEVIKAYLGAEVD